MGRYILIWFHEHYIPECCTQLHCQAILESLVCFSFAKNVKTFTKNHFHYKIYQSLSLYDILTWVDFIANAAIVGGLMLIDLEICIYLGKLKKEMPVQWMELIRQSQMDFQSQSVSVINSNPNATKVQCTSRNDLLTKRLEGRMSVKGWYQWLISKHYIINEAAIDQWEADLNINDLKQEWERVCKRYFIISNPRLQDFAQSFIQRRYLLNVTLAKFSNVTESCSFCHASPESRIHLYWECPKIVKVWKYVTYFCNEYIDEDVEMFKQNCVL